MNEQIFSTTDFIQLVLYLGSLTYIIGLIYQLWIIYRQAGIFKIKVLILIVITRLLTITSTLLIWAYWTMELDIMFGILLLPAVIPELILSPLLLRLFGYNLWRKNKLSN